MAEASRVKVRVLPGGELWEAVETGWTGRVVHIEYTAQTLEIPPAVGVPVEIDTGTKVYLGILEDSTASGASVLVEHLLDSSNIEWIDRVWS
jgi:hypothetical protein